jgi:hypothetical protein
MDEQEERMEKHKKYVVKVTAENINTATPRESGHCMIADAVRECLPNAQRVMVDLQCTRWTDVEKQIRYIALTPARAQKALVDFDQGIEVEPFTMTLYPFQTVKAGGRSTGTPKLQEPKTVTPGVVQNNQKGNPSVSPPHVQGGRTPPRAALANYRGKRRQFGVRMLDQ